MLPELCPRCLGPTERGFCAGCRADFSIVPQPCPGCGLPAPVARCPRRDPFWRIAHVVAPYVYRAPLSGQLHALKFLGARAHGRAFGLLLSAALEADRRTVDALLAVPLHASRLRERGYNQAAEIARTVSLETRIPLLDGGARRRFATLPQSMLRLGQRRANLAEAFALTRECSGLSIAIVDDVVTTGATVNALAATALEAGAAQVEVWAPVRTLEHAEAPAAPVRIPALQDRIPTVQARNAAAQVRKR